MNRWVRSLKGARLCYLAQVLEIAEIATPRYLPNADGRQNRDLEGRLGVDGECKGGNGDLDCDLRFLTLLPCLTAQVP